MPPSNPPRDYNLLELFKQKRPLVDILGDPTALFVLAFVNEIGETTRAGLQGELALTADEFAQVIANLNYAELIGTQVDKLYVTDAGREFLDDLGLGAGGLPPATNAGRPTTGGTPSWLWGFIAFLATALVLLIAAVVAVLVLLPRLTPTPTITPPIELVFSADRTNLFVGECTMLNWQVHAAAWVELNGQRVAPIDQMQVCPDKSTFYALIAGGGIGARRDLTINVQAPPVPPTLAPTPIPPPTSVPTLVPTLTSVPTLVPPPTRVPPTPLPGALKGIVTRAADGFPIYKAVVQMSGAPTTTGDNGGYSFPALAPGNYTVNVSAPGYFDQQNSVTIASGQTATLNFALIKAPAATGTGVTLQQQDCFDFEQPKYYPIPSGVEFYTCPSSADVQWWTNTLRAVNRGVIMNAIPQGSAYEDCTISIPVNSTSVANPQVTKYYCVSTGANRTAVVRITGVDAKSNTFVSFDWWLY